MRKCDNSMTFKDLDIKPEYRSFQDDIIRDFYIPVLENSVFYKRAVGFFSSTALIEVSKGISGLIKNSGKMQLIASPQLSEEDIEAIRKGYKIREEVINKIILRDLDLSTKDYYEKKRLNFLAHLIASGTLDIKIAFIESNDGIGIYHEKMGILKDFEGNKIVFAGSINESKTALTYNYEAFDVFCSWTNDLERITSKEQIFDKLWNNEVKRVRAYDFPKVAKEKLKSYIFEGPDLVLDKKEFYVTNTYDEKEQTKTGPRIPSWVELREYQWDAIDKWEEQGFRGIFDMATGSGKTFTGLGAVCRLYEKTKNNLAVVIVCPYQHLVEQWVEDIEQFGMEPIVGYSASKQKNWKKNLQDEIEYFNHGITEHFCFVTTNATFSSDFVQKQLNSLEGNLLLLVDEAHNFGAEHLKKKLLKNANYRLALSATIERYNDEDGTNALYDYFGDKCIEYTLEMAIRSGMLTPYYYYPIIVSLNEEELEEYKKLSAELTKMLTRDKFGKVKLSESAKHILIKRARLVAGAQNKINELAKVIKEYQQDSHILVYCGATTINDLTYVEGRVDQEEARQIDIVTSLLGNQLNMKVSKYTSEESTEEREELKKVFSEGEQLQALIAIRCLDEGVNIPSIKTAFILASSTNPKEYIQRRGRVLRKYEGKTHAVIYDFITLPIPIEDAWSLDKSELHSVSSLPLRELERMRDFASIAENSSVADKLINEIEDAFYLRELGVINIEY